VKYFSLYILFFVATVSYSQETNYNIQDGYVAGGYDLVTYFEDRTTIGDDSYVFIYDNVAFKFSSARTLKLFKNSPNKYIPQYGGWCAYAIALKNKQVRIDPNTYEVRAGKLYLFYKTKFINTHKKWLAKTPDELIRKANVNWVNISTD